MVINKKRKIKNKKKLLKEFLFEKISNIKDFKFDKKKLKCFFFFEYHFFKNKGFKSAANLKITNSVNKNSFPQKEKYFVLFDERVEFYENLSKNNKIETEKKKNIKKIKIID